ncbi:MAG: hypothetical protein Q9210_006042, partial [Variospora velana]
NGLPSNTLTDPFRLQVPNEPIYLLLSGFLNPARTPFEPILLYDLAQRAQADIVKEVLAAKRDTPILVPNQEWCSWHGRRPVCLRVNWKYLDQHPT